MSLPLMRLHKTVPLLMTACCLCLPLSQAGCEGDVDAADKQVREHLTEGLQKSEAAVSSAPNVPDAYKKAAAVSNASPAARAEAMTRLAAAQRDRALALMGEADRLGVDLMRLVGATNRQSVRIQSNNTLIAGLARTEPTQATRALEAQRGAAQGQEKPIWVEHETGAIPALKGLEEQGKQLQDQIAQLEGQAKDLGAQRTKLIADAEQTEQQSDQAQGQQSAELYNQSVDARKQAADLAVQVEALEAKLMPLRQDLERVQASQQAIARTVEAFGGKLQTTQQNWQKVQEQIAALQQLNKRILDGTGGTEPVAVAAAPAPAQPGDQPEADASGGAAPRPASPVAQMAPSIAGKLRQVNDVVAQIEARRMEADGLLKEAIDNTDKAGTAAEGLVSTLGTQSSASGASQRPEQAAWKSMSELHNPSRYKLKHASLQILLADVYRSRAADLALRANMAQLLAVALQPAQLTMPQEAGGSNLQAESDAARAASIAQYTEAEKELADVVQAPKSNDMMGDAAKAAHLMQLVRLYSQAQTDPQTASTLAAKARSVAAEGDQVQLPATALPMFMQDALELRTPPTTGPATRPAGGTAAPAPGAATPTTPVAPPAPPGATTPPGTATPPGAPTPPGTATPAAPVDGAGGQPAPATDTPPTPPG